MGTHQAPLVCRPRVSLSRRVRRFTHNYLLSLHNSLSGPDGKLALDVMARSLAYVSLLGGVVALPFLDDLLDLWEKFFGTPVRSNMKKTLRDFGGPVMEKMGMAGIPALMGIDISGSLKVGLPFTSLAGAQGTPADTVYGVYAGLGKKGLNAMNAAERQDYLRALEFASPCLPGGRAEGLPHGRPGRDHGQGQGPHRRAGKADSARDRRGDRPGCRLPSGEAGADLRRALDAWRTCKSNFKGRRDDLYARYRLAKTPEERQKVIRDMQRFNMDARKYRGVISPITTTSLKQSAAPRPDKGFMAFGRMMEASM